MRHQWRIRRSMKRIFSVFLAIFALCAVSVLNAEVNKEELFTNMAAKYPGTAEMSGKFEISMPMMGSIMKMPATFWKKGDRMRMDMTITQPGMPKPMEMVMLMDSEKIIQYQKMMNMVITIDLTKLPAEMREQMKKKQMFGMDKDTMNNFKDMLDKIEVTEKTRDGKNFYLITVNDLEKITNMVSMPGGQQAPQQMFKKMLVWVCTDSLFYDKMEIYGEADTPAMWIDFLEFKTESVPDSVFNLDIPKDAKVMDMTDMIKNMTESMKQN